MQKFFLNSISDNVLHLFSDIWNIIPEQTNVLFIPTAADHYLDKSFIQTDLQTRKKIWYKVSILNINKYDQKEIEGKIKTYDVIHISWWNIFYLLQVIQSCWLQKSLKKFLKWWGIYSWSSAWAAIVWPSIKMFQNIDKLEKWNQLKNYDWFWFIDKIVLPHYYSKKYYQEFNRIIDTYPEFSFQPLWDNQALYISWSESTLLEVS